MCIPIKADPGHVLLAASTWRDGLGFGFSNRDGSSKRFRAHCDRNHARHNKPLHPPHNTKPLNPAPRAILRRLSHSFCSYRLAYV